MNQVAQIKKIALIIFGIDFVAITIGIAKAIILDRSPMRYFGEGGHVTWVSTLQLLLAGVLCIQIAQIRNQSYSERKINQTPLFWWIAGLGMFFLALDETLEIHENLDKSIHRWLGIQSTSLSGRLDDFIVLFYAGLGLFTIYTFRRELLRYKSSFSWFSLGVGLSLLTIAFDMIGHNRATFEPLADSLEELNRIHHWAGTIEEIPKIFAGGAFLVSLFVCKLMARNFRDRERQQRLALDAEKANVR